MTHLYMDPTLKRSATCRNLQGIIDLDAARAERRSEHLNDLEVAIENRKSRFFLTVNLMTVMVGNYGQTPNYP